MEKEQAIELLDNLIGMVEDNHNSDYDAALHMAIKALEQEPTPKNDLGVDLISRADARKVIIDHQYSDSFCEEHNIDHSINMGMALIVLSDLPSVTPQEPQTFRWCTGCREYDQEKHCCHRWSKVIRDTVEEMKQEQEPKTGHWIPTYGNVKCSVCGSVKDSREVGKATHYCDFCGAKMVEPQESETDNGTQS